jgi:hypothetical protein
MKNDFLKKEKTRLATAFEKKIIGDRTRISFAEIKKLDLPEALLSSLQKQAGTIFKTEKPVRIVQTERFEFSDQKIKTALSTLRHVLLDQVNFLPQEIRKSINFSLTIHFDLIVLPFQTIDAILFQTEEPRISQECIEILNGIGEDFAPIKALTDKLLAHDSEHVSRADFDLLTEQIKSQLYREHPVSAMLFDLDHLQNFYAKLTGTARIEYPADVIHAMLLERGMDDFAKGFADEKKEKTNWRIEEMQQFLERHLLVGQLQHDNNFASHIVYPEEIERNPVEKQSQASSADEKKTTEKASPQNRNEGDKPGNGLDLRKMQEIQGRSFRTKMEFDDTSTDLIDRKQIEYQPPGPYPSLLTIIDNKSRGIFIKKIFDKDKSAYVSFIDHIEKKESWKEAKAILDMELASRKISPFCREAVQLSDIIFARYFSKGNF